MTNHGDDCYFFYYSTCAKGDSCPFRHCEAAMGNEVVCNLWQEGHCFRTVCKFRHMEIKKNRREIACYWENQPAGCQKPHCAFHHEKPRFVEGRYIPADKGSAQQEVVEPPEDSAPLPPPPPPLPTAANPQLRGVIKAETQESVPSPTHPPVVINPADDDEDEDDQFSEEEASPRKLAVGSSSDESLNFGIRTLEEIRLRKALKASMKRYAQPMGEDPHPLSGQRTNGVREKENIRSFTGPIIFNASNDIFGEETRRPNIAERLGNRIITKDVPATSGDLHPKRRLAERLGRIVGEEESDMAPPRALKPIRDRLGMPMDPSVAVESSVKPIRERLGMPAEPSSAMESACVRVEPEPRPRSEKAAGEVRIKTLEEIRQAKAAKNPKQKTAAPATKTSPTKTSPKGSKRTVTVVASSLAPAKTFSEFIHSKRKLEEENPQQQPSLKKTKLQPAEAPGESQGPAEAAMPSRTPSSGAEVRVKTLEEIRREKAARTQAQRVEAGNGDSLEKVSGSEEDGAKKSRLLRIKKPASPVASTQKTAELPTNGAKIEEPPTTATEAQPRSVGGSLSTNGSVKVKTFEEIMREKRLRRQQLEDQASSTPPAATTTPPAAASTTPATSSSEAEPAQKQEPAGAPLPRKIPIRARRTPASASSSSSPTPPLEAPPKTVRQRISLKPKVASPVASSSQRGSPPRQAEADSPSLSPTSTRTSPGKRRVSPGPAVSKQAKGAASPRPSVEEPVVSQAQPGIQRKSPGQATEAKVRPKLNVKPSVVKPAAQVRPGQKRRAAESAVAAVKPLNSASGGRDEPRSKRIRASPAITISSHLDNEAQQSATVPPRTPPTQSGPGTSPLRVEPQTAPVTSTVPSVLPTESSVMKTPSQARPRRSSVVTPTTAAASSTVDDFDDLLNEFTGDDRLEDELELDHGKGDDDLLMELSEMIDS